MKKKLILGRKDKADFPEMSLKGIDIKIDTGAYTSAIHCHNITTSTIDGIDTLTFTLLDPTHSKYDGKEYNTAEFSEKRIKNSFGSSEKRFIIETKILLFGKINSIELSLSSRGKMKFPILIGRRFLMGKYIVDSSRYDLSYKKSKKRKA